MSALAAWAVTKRCCVFEASRLPSLWDSFFRYLLLLATALTRFPPNPGDRPKAPLFRLVVSFC